MFKPKLYEQYYFVNGYGEICCKTYNNSSSDADLISSDNCFESPQEAKQSDIYKKTNQY